MNLITILIWITIVIIGAIAIIAVKLHYKGDELEHEEGSILPNAGSIVGSISGGTEKLQNHNNPPKTAPRSLSPQKPQQQSLFKNNAPQKSDDTYIVHEVKENNLNNYEYESQNQVLINYDNSVEKTQEPIKESQMDIMTQNKNTSNENKSEEPSELKDLFTIDELIKESKRKDSEREKESQKIHREEDPAELDELKDSIKNKNEEPLIEEVILEDEKEEEDKKEETINDLINETPQTETPSEVSQNDADETISEEASESEEETEIITEDNNITEVLPDSPKEEPISEPALKTPSKIDEPAPTVEDKKEEGMDLDYRNDIKRVKKKIRGSKLYQEVKGRINPAREEIPERQESQETYIRSVNEYEDEYEPIINETHVAYEDATYEDYHEQRIRQENTRRVFKNTQKSPEVEPEKPQRTEIKDKPARNNIKININNNEVVLKKGDEIIFNYDGDTYSSQVYAINGDDISVKYRRKNIKIKPGDVKKIY